MNRLLRVFGLTILLLGLTVGSGYSSNILIENTCVTPIAGANLLSGAIDGSSYYQVLEAVNFPGLPANSMDLLVWSMDIKFGQDGAGFTPMSSDGLEGTCVRSFTRRDKYQLAVQAGSTVFIPYMEIDPEQWYHIELMGKYSTPDAFMYLLIWTYDEAGERTELRTFSSVNMRNLSFNKNNGAAYIRVEPNTSVDNVKIFYPTFDELTISGSSELVMSGETVKYQAVGYRYGIELVSEGAVDFLVYDKDDTKLLNDPSLTIDSQGLLIAKPSARTQDVIVRVASFDGSVGDSVPLKVRSSSIFAIESLGIEQDFGRVIDIEVTKNIIYDGPAVCVVEVYDDTNTVQELATRDINTSLIGVKESKVLPLGLALPIEFDEDTWQIKVSIVSSVD